MRRLLVLIVMVLALGCGVQPREVPPQEDPPQEIPPWHPEHEINQP